MERGSGRMGYGSVILQNGAGGYILIGAWSIYTGNGSNIILSSDQTEAALSRGAGKTWKWIRKQEYGGWNKMKKIEFSEKEPETIFRDPGRSNAHHICDTGILCLGG